MKNFTTLFLRFLFLFPPALPHLVDVQKFTLDFQDKIAIDVDLFLPPELFLNELKITKTDALYLTVPKSYTKNSVFDKTNEKIIDLFRTQANFKNKLGFLFRDKETRQWMVIQKTIDSKFNFVSRIFQIAPEDFNCHKLKMDSTFFYVSCISTIERNFQLCQADYQNKTDYFCRSLDYKIPEYTDIGYYQANMNLISVGEQQLFAFYI